jgi:hypothetical protein
MSAQIVQVQPEPWPSGYGEVVAVLDLAFETLAQRLGLELCSGTDNLDNYHAAAIRLPSGRRIGLLHHEGDSPDVTQVHADARDHPQTVMREVLQALDVPDTAVSWVRGAQV